MQYIDLDNYAGEYTYGLSLEEFKKGIIAYSKIKDVKEQVEWLYTLAGNGSNIFFSTRYTINKKEYWLGYEHYLTTYSEVPQIIADFMIEKEIDLNMPRIQAPLENGLDAIKEQGRKDWINQELRLIEEKVNRLEVRLSKVTDLDEFAFLLGYRKVKRGMPVELEDFFEIPSTQLNYQFCSQAGEGAVLATIENWLREELAKLGDDEQALETNQDEVLGIGPNNDISLRSTEAQLIYLKYSGIWSLIQSIIYKKYGSYNNKVASVVISRFIGKAPSTIEVLLGKIDNPKQPNVKNSPYKSKSIEAALNALEADGFDATELWQVLDQKNSKQNPIKDGRSKY